MRLGLFLLQKSSQGRKYTALGRISRCLIRVEYMDPFVFRDVISVKADIYVELGRDVW